jgi:Ca-activated chloride channel homolog
MKHATTGKGGSLRWSKLLAGALVGAALAGCGAPTAADYVQRGNALYDQGIYGQALPQYKEAVGLAPDHPVPNINLGNTRYELGDYLGAIESSKDALKNADPATQAIIYYNQGNAYYRMDDLEKAIDSYKEALRRNPADGDAKYNLELAQREQEQQQQQQQQAGGQGQEPQEGQPQPQEGGQEPQDQPGQGQQEPQEPQDGSGGQQQRPSPPPSSLSPDEAERQLDQLRRSEDRRNEDLYDNYAVGGDQDDVENGNGPTDNGW